MIILFSKQFKKKIQKQSAKIKVLFVERLELFKTGIPHQELNIHKLKGEYMDYKSFNVTRDIRVVYKLISQNTAYLIDIDTHSNLYK